MAMIIYWRVSGKKREPRNESLLKPWNFGPLDPFSAGLCMRPGAPFTGEAHGFLVKFRPRRPQFWCLVWLVIIFPIQWLYYWLYCIYYIYTWKYILDFQSDPSRWNWFLGGFHLSFWGCLWISPYRRWGVFCFQGTSRLVDDDRIFMWFKYQNYGDIV